MLPPIGSTESTDLNTLLDHVSRLAEEAADARAPHIAIASQNRNVYAYGEEYPTGLIVSNEIQNAIIAATDIQTKEPIRATLSGVESGEQGTILWAGPQEVGIQLGLLPQQVAAWTDPATGMVNPPIPVEPQQAEVIRLSLPSDKALWIVEITDELAAKSMQQVFDKVWSRSKLDRRITGNLLATNIDGWQFAYYHWIPTELRCELLPLSPSQVFIDTCGVEDISDAQYAGVDLVLDADKATRMFPRLADAIEANAGTGQPRREAGSDGLGAVEQSYQRPMVTIRIWWLRNQPIPMTPQEMAEQGMDPSDVEFRYALRQVTIIGGQVQEDAECPYPEMPLLHNVNIPIPGRPFGLGEPYRLKGLQDARNSILRAEESHAEYFRHPPAAISQSMANALPAAAAKRFSKPGMEFTIPDDLYRQMGGKLAIFSEIPEFSASLITMDDRLRREITESSGHTEVLQGRANSQMSGKAIETLQTAAASLIGFKSQRTGHMIEALANLILYSISHEADPVQIARIVSRYPINVLTAILRRVKSVEWDINVIVSIGSGQILAAKKAEARADLQLGAISMQTYREKTGIDVGLEQRRSEDQMRKMAQSGVAPQRMVQTPPKE